MVDLEALGKTFAFFGFVIGVVLVFLFLLMWNAFAVFLGLAIFIGSIMFYHIYEEYRGSSEGEK